MRIFLIFTIIILLGILVNVNSFLDNVYFYLSGSVFSISVKNNWPFVFLNILVFLSLLFFLGRKTIDWKSKGIFSAFIISLFVEMYGFPLSMYLISGNLVEASNHEILFKLDLFFIKLGIDFWMAFGGLIIILGTLIIALGWYQLWKSKKTLFTEGFYKYSRHPQYFGFLLIVWGWFIAWPTILTLLMAPVLTYFYLNAAKKEEAFLIQKNKEYLNYVRKVPFIL